MTNLRKHLTIALAVTAFVGLAQCGGTTNSGQTKLKILDPDPVIINAPITLSIPPPADSPVGTAPTTQAINANWYLFNVEVDNNSPEQLTLVNFDLNMSGVDSNGVLQTTQGSLDVSFTCDPPSGSLITSRTYVAVINSGGIYTHLGDPNGCDPTTAIGGTPFENWYIGGLDTSVTNWTVEVIGQGWFTDSSGEPNERLVLYNYFTTQ